MKNLAFILVLILAVANISFAQKQTNQVETLLKQGELYLEQYEFEKALASCGKALQKIQSVKRKSPAQLASVYFFYGEIYEKGLYLDKAIEAYRSALKFAPKNAGIYERRGNIYQYVGETEKAESDFTTAANLIKNGKNSTPSTTIATVIGSKADGEISVSEYPEEFQTIEFIEISGYMEGIEIADMNHDGKISDEEFRRSFLAQLLKLHKLVRFNPKSDLALWKRGDLFLQINEFSNQFFWVSAESDFIDAFELKPRYEYLVNRGVVRAKRDNKTNYEFAVKFFSDALEINRKSVEALYNRGLSYLKLNENEKAIVDFSEVIKLNPKFIIAYKSRARAFRAIGKIAEAEADDKMIKTLARY
jgi:tetratricopeptide (TPR) repeat protein